MNDPDPAPTAPTAPGTPPRAWPAIAAAAACAALSALALHRLDTPYPWVALLWTGFAAWRAVGSRRSGVRAVWVNVGAVLLALGAAEAWLAREPQGAPAERYEGSYTTDYFRDDAVLGYGPAPGITATASKYHGDTRVYETVYTIDDRGLRVSPPGTGATGHVLFFGGSVTFGEGVADEQAAPYRVGMLTGGRYGVDNFAFHGYGPHQMLAAMRAGRMDTVASAAPTHVVYQAIPAHVARSAGLASWDRHGPRFVPDAAGGVRLAGRFDDSSGALHALARRWAEKSRIYRRILGRERALRDADYALFVAIVRAARDEIARRHPGAAFHVLLWGYPGDGEFERLRAGLTGAGVSTHPIAEVLPGYAEDASRYELGPHDAHPSAEAHALIARYVVTRILDEPVARAPGKPTRAAGAPRPEPQGSPIYSPAIRAHGDST